MKKRSHYLLLSFFLLMILTFGYGVAKAESQFVLPASLEIIEEDAFYGIQADTVVLSDKLEQIGPRAFAYGRINEIHLPSSIIFIDDSAFEGTDISVMTAEKGTYAYDWAVRNKYINPCPVTIIVDSIAGDDNLQHFHTYGQSHRFSGSITSTVAIRSIRSSVVFTEGEKSGQSAYDCKNAVVQCDNGVYSIDIRSSNLNNYLKFGYMPCAPLKLCLYADLYDETSFLIFEYDFEIICPCNSIILSETPQKMYCGESLQLSPSCSPSETTYDNQFFYESSNPDVLSVDENGLLTAKTNPGVASIIIHSFDRFASISFEVSVLEKPTWEECPVSVTVTDNAGLDNISHYHEFGSGHRFAGTISSTVPIYSIRADIVFRGGELDGQSAYDCSNATVYCADDVYSIDIRNSNLNNYLKFGSMPCAPLKMYLYADLVDGSSFTIYEYDFEILRKCTSVLLNYTEKHLKYGAGFWIIPKVTPANATYINSFYFVSSNSNIVSVDEFGFVQAHNKSGTAVITVYTGDGNASATCIVTVTSTLINSPQIVDYIAQDSIYDSLGTWIFLNYTQVEGATSYEFSRATSINGPFSTTWVTDGLDTEYISNPFPAYLFSFDSDCNEDTTYYYRIRAKSSTGEYSDYSNVFKANSTVIRWVDSNEDVWITISDALIVSECIDDESGNNFSISGTVQSNYELTNITADIYNKWGTLMTRKVVEPCSQSYQLSGILLDISSFENGVYKLVIKATANKETMILAKPVFFIERTEAIVPTTEQLQRDIVTYASNHNASVFNPGEEIEYYLSQMGTKDIIAMALSDYTNIAISWLKDKLTSNEYSSYMEQQYEAQIISILNDMNSEGKIEKIRLSTPVTNMIKSLNNLTKNGNKVRLDTISDVFEQYGGSGIDWDELSNLLIIKEECERLSYLYDEIKAGEEFVNIVCELFANHAKDLEALDIVSRTYNPNGDPSFNEAMRRIRASYKTQFGSSLRMIFNKLEKELEKEAFKEITKAILTKSASHLYSLADTIVQITLKISGITEAGKNRIDFVTQYTSLISFRRAYSNALLDIVDSYAAGKLPTEKQIHQLQVTFQCTRQAYIQLNQTMMNLDESNIGAYLYYIDNAEKMTLPGLDRLESSY